MPNSSSESELELAKFGEYLLKERIEVSRGRHCMARSTLPPRFAGDNTDVQWDKLVLYSLSAFIRGFSSSAFG